MGSLGWHNPVPFAIGGGPTDDENVYEALKRAVGTGGIALNETGIDGLWRQCKASAVASLNSFADRAALQVFPNLATDHIPVYEALLNITPRANATDVERRAANTAAFTRDIESDGPHVRQQIQAVDSRADIYDIPRSTSITTVLGKAFEPQDGIPTYGPTKSTGYPNYSTEMYVPVLLNLGSSPSPGAADLLVIGQLKRLMRDVLPAWVDFAVITTAPGFYLDLSPLDFTAMS